MSERTVKDVMVEYQFSMQEGSYGTNPATIKAEFMPYTDLKLLFAEIDSLRAENAKLREIQDGNSNFIVSLAHEIDKSNADLARLRELLGEVMDVGRNMRNDFNQFGGGGWVNIWDETISRIQSELKE